MMVYQREGLASEASSAEAKYQLGRKSTLLPCLLALTLKPKLFPSPCFETIGVLWYINTGVNAKLLQNGRM